MRSGEARACSPVSLIDRGLKAKITMKIVFCAVLLLPTAFACSAPFIQHGIGAAVPVGTPFVAPVNSIEGKTCQQGRQVCHQNLQHVCGKKDQWINLQTTCKSAPVAAPSVAAAPTQRASPVGKACKQDQSICHGGIEYICGKKDQWVPLSTSTTCK